MNQDERARYEELALKLAERKEKLLKLEKEAEQMKNRGFFARLFNRKPK